MRSPYTEHAASGLPNPTPLDVGRGGGGGGGVRFIQAQDQQVLKISHVNISRKNRNTKQRVLIFLDAKKGLSEKGDTTQ